MLENSDTGVGCSKIDSYSGLFGCHYNVFYEYKLTNILS